MIIRVNNAIQPRARSRIARAHSPDQLDYTDRSGRKSAIRGDTVRALKSSKGIRDTVQSPRSVTHTHTIARVAMLLHRVRAYTRSCAWRSASDACAQEAATVILQIISREHAIPLKITRLRRGQRAVHFGPFSRAHVRAHASPRTRGFRCRARTPANVAKDTCGSQPRGGWRGLAPPITVINRDVKAKEEAVT